MPLIKFDRFKIQSGEIKPEKVVSIKDQPYEINAKGSVIVDLNSSSTTSRRKLISMYTKKPSQIKFEQVIDTTFQDFVIEERSNTIELLQSRLNALLGEKNALLGERDTSRAQIDSLNDTIEELRRQLELAVNEIANINPIIIDSGAAISEPEILNSVPDTLPLRGSLVSDRRGLPGDPGYPLKQNSLLSKNRKARAVLQSDGNFIITIGEYDKDANPIGPEDVVAAIGWNNGETSPDFLTLFNDTNGDPRDLFFTIGGLQPTYQQRWKSPNFKARKQGRGGKLVLNDEGLLNLYDDDQLLWTSYGFDFASGGTFLRYTPKTAAPTPPPAPVATSAPPIISNVPTAPSTTVPINTTNIIPADPRLYKNEGPNFGPNRIQPVGRSARGINIYSFRFVNNPIVNEYNAVPRTRYQGVIADELYGTPFESAISLSPQGYALVDYSKLDVEFKRATA
jgi:hypothetical protein